jgi:hypothetical protein
MNFSVSTCRVRGLLAFGADGSGLYAVRRFLSLRGRSVLLVEAKDSPEVAALLQAPVAEAPEICDGEALLITCGF